MIKAERFESGVAWLVITAACISTSWFFGKDVNWDLLNYHLYGPHLALHGSVQMDFMAAGPQAYLNPLPHFPFYGMVMAGWPSLSIGATLALVHSLSLYLIWRMSRDVLFIYSTKPRTWAWLTTALAMTSPVFLGTMGGTFSDPLLAPLVFASVLLLIGLPGSPNQVRACLFSGILLGLATGLKLTNAVFVLAAGPCLAWVALRSGNWRSVLAFVIALAAGFLVAYAWWGWRLLEEFGNPFFPLLNQHFKAPDFPVDSLRHERFLPESWIDLIALPLRMLQHHSWIYVENMAPDLRPAALILLLPACVWVWLRSSRASDAGWIAPSPRMLFAVYLVGAYLLWQLTSGNGRYALPLLLWVAVALALALQLVLPQRWAMAAMAALFAGQVVHGGLTGNPRWTAMPWGERWLEVSPPERLRQSPHGFVAIGLNSNSFVAPFLHKDSAFLGLTEMYPLLPESPGASRVRRFLDEHSEKLQLLVRGPKDFVGLDAKQGEALNKLLVHWGIVVDGHACEVLAKFDAPPPAFSVLTCRLQSIPVADSRIEERAQVARVFSAVEKACPLLFSPPGWPVSPQHGYWQRRYLNTDIVLRLIRGRVSFSRYDFGPFDIDLGTSSDWLEGNGRMHCAKLQRQW